MNRRTNMLRASAVAVVLVMATTMFGQEKCSTSGPVCDPRFGMAYEYMHAHFGDEDGPLSVWLARDYGEKGRLRLERRENRFEALARWAETLEPADKSAYLAAIEMYEKGARDAYSEWHTHKTELKQIAYEEYLKRCAEAKRKAAATKPLPKPPNALSEDKP
jgi:hypothetical protein